MTEKGATRDSCLTQLSPADGVTTPKKLVRK